MAALSLPSTLTHDQAQACLQHLQAGMAQLPAGAAVQIDASALAVFDSSALAVMLGSRRAALGAGRPFEMRGVSAPLLSLARLYGVDGLLTTAG
ncbi:STAS domain-containing protein [Comamonas sp. MYb21]|uniref:STAS domain-containing protein n=1 Tax=unclassified Comamonas TaxID=2638500 RepID=UPI0003959EE5|nr:STAS domain-containing protein [Comamonas sp. B-9]